MQITRTLLDRTYEFLSKRPVYHGLFWIAVLSWLLGMDYFQNYDLWGAWSNELVTLVFMVVVVYFNLEYLIPNYMARSVVVYFGLLIASCMVITPIEVLVFYIKYTGNFDFQNTLVTVQQWYLFVANCIMALLSTVLRVIMDWWRYQREKQELITQNMQSELRFLKSQINPHFLFNTLNNLYALTLKKSDNAPDIVLKLAEIMRYMLYDCNERRVHLSKEIHYIQNYLDLERLRQPKDATIVFSTEGIISEQLVAPLLFVPFVENSFKHGLNHQLNGNGFVRIHLKVAGEELEFMIENSKTDNLPRHSHPRSGGIGLVNVRQRLNLLYPDAYKLEIEDEPGKYTVRLSLKMI